METAVSTLSVFPNTKEQVSLFANKLKTELENGEVNPLEIITMQKAIEKVFDAVKPILTELARTEAEKHGKSFNFKGANISLVEVGAKYDYSGCGHLDYNALCAEIEKLTEKKKNHEEMMKSFKEPQQMVSIDGEPMLVYPPKKTSASSIKVTL